MKIVPVLGGFRVSLHPEVPAGSPLWRLVNDNVYPTRDEAETILEGYCLFYECGRDAGYREGFKHGHKAGIFDAPLLGLMDVIFAVLDLTRKANDAARRVPLSRS